MLYDHVCPCMTVPGSGRIPPGTLQLRPPPSPRSSGTTRPRSPLPWPRRLPRPWPPVRLLSSAPTLSIGPRQTRPKGQGPMAARVAGVWAAAGCGGRWAAWRRRGRRGRGSFHGRGRRCRWSRPAVRVGFTSLKESGPQLRALATKSFSRKFESR